MSDSAARNLDYDQDDEEKRQRNDRRVGDMNQPCVDKRHGGERDEAHERSAEFSHSVVR